MIILDIFAQPVIQGPGTGTFTEHLLEIVLMLLAAFVLGYWIGRIRVSRYKKREVELNNELNALKAEAVAYEDKKLELETLNEKIRLLEHKNAQLRIDSKSTIVEKSDPVLEAKVKSQDQLIAELRTEIETLKKEKTNFSATPIVAKTVDSKANAKPIQPVSFATKDGKDDLKKIEGIGPKIEQLLNEGDIFTFQQMIDGGVDKIQAILDKAGPLYKVHDPGTWTNQARLAAEGKWDELLIMQTELKGGKKV